MFSDDEMLHCRVLWMVFHDYVNVDVEPFSGEDLFVETHPMMPSLSLSFDRVMTFQIKMAIQAFSFFPFVRSNSKEDSIS